MAVVYVRLWQSFVDVVLLSCTFERFIFVLRL